MRHTQSLWYDLNVLLKYLLKSIIDIGTEKTNKYDNIIIYWMSFYLKRSLYN